MSSRWSSRKPKEPPPPKLKVDLGTLHPVVAASARGYLGVQAGRDGTYGEQAHAGLKIRVSPPNLERALLLADRLFKAAEERGYKIGSKEGEGKGGDILVDGEAVRVDVKEKLESRINKDEDRSWRKRNFIPTGLLLFVIGDGYGSKPECGDSTRWKAEDRIDKVLEKVVEYARQEKESRIKWEKKHKEFEEEWQRKQEEERRQLEEQRKGDEFLGLIQQWKKAEEIRAFVGQLRSLALGIGKVISPTSALGKRIAWAEKHADQLDPIRKVGEQLAKRELEDVE